MMWGKVSPTYINGPELKDGGEQEANIEPYESSVFQNVEEVGHRKSSQNRTHGCEKSKKGP